MTQKALFDFGLAEPLPHPAPRVEPLTVEDAATCERAMSGNIAATQRDQILALLRQGAVTNFDLANVCIRYSARIHELRKAGHDIETVSKIAGKDKSSTLVVYRLKEGT